MWTLSIPAESPGSCAGPWIVSEPLWAQLIQETRFSQLKWGEDSPLVRGDDKEAYTAMVRLGDRAKAADLFKQEFDSEKLSSAVRQESAATDDVGAAHATCAKSPATDELPEGAPKSAPSAPAAVPGPKSQANAPEKKVCTSQTPMTLHESLSAFENDKGRTHHGPVSNAFSEPNLFFWSPSPPCYPMFPHAV